MNLEQVIIDKSNFVQKVGSCLIEATPEHWNSFYVLAEVTSNKGEPKNIRVSLGSNEGLDDLVICTDELNQSVFELIDAFDQEVSIKSFKIDVFQKEDGKWAFETDVKLFG